MHGEWVMPCKSTVFRRMTFFLYFQVHVRQFPSWVYPEPAGWHWISLVSSSFPHQRFPSLAGFWVYCQPLITFPQKLRASSPRERLQKILNSKRRHPIQEICRVGQWTQRSKLNILLSNYQHSGHSFTQASCAHNWVKWSALIWVFYISYNIIAIQGTPTQLHELLRYARSLPFQARPDYHDLQVINFKIMCWPILLHRSINDIKTIFELSWVLHLSCLTLLPAPFPRRKRDLH